MDNLNEEWSQSTNPTGASEHQFIVTVPSSQSEDAWTDSCPDFNTSTLRQLPGLHPKPEETSKDSEVIELVMDPHGKQHEDGDDVEKGILVMDSEVESKQRTDTTSDDVHTVEESVSEDNQKLVTQSGSASSNDADVTVIEKDVGARSKESDQYVLSQEDMFKGKDEEEEVTVRSTPSRTVPSLQLSAEPMLVQETVEEEDHICPSPDAYGDVPLIIPNSPTMTPAETGDEMLFNPVGTCTLDSGHHRRRPPQPSASPSLLMEESQEKSQSPIESPIGRLQGPTLAGEMWQQRAEGFGQSQDLHLYLTPSQPSQSQPRASDEFKLSVPRQGGQQLSQLSVPRQGGQQLSQPVEHGTLKEVSKSDNSSSSHGDGSSADLPLRVEGKTKAPISIDMVHSESQSASETTFRLQRPDTSLLNPGEQSMEREEGASEISVFARTRLGTRHIKKTAHLASGEESSADFLAEKAQESGNESSSSSLPCSQNRSTRRQAAKRETSDRSMEVEAEVDKPAEDVDVFGADTVMDSEPEGDEESTQTYNVFPALSKSPAPAPARSVVEEEMAVDEIEVPVLPDTSISSLKPPQPASQPVGSQGRGGTASGAETAVSAVRQRRGENRDGQKKVTDTGDGALQDATARGLTQGSQSQREPETFGAELQTRQSQQGRSQDRGSQQSGQKKSQEDSASQRASQRRQKDTSGGAEVHTEPASPVGHNPGPVTSKAGQREETGKETTVSQSTPPARQLFDPQPDPFTFHGSQSQVQEGVDNTSRAETSVSTLRASTRRDGLSTYKRKRLIKKKNEHNPREPEVTSPSTDETAPAPEAPAKPPKKGKKGAAKSGGVVVETFETKALPPTETGTQGFQPALPAENVSTRNPPAAPSTGAAGISAVVLPPPVPSTSWQSAVAGRGGSSQESRPTTRKRRSVEFAETVQTASPLHPYSLEHSLSDSQSSDTMLEETHVREVVFRIVQRFITVRRFDGEGKMIDEKTTEEKGEPVMLEENEITKKRKIYAPLSPSRSGSTLTSGDLGDISSSSLSLKTSSGPSSLEVDRPSLSVPSAPEQSASLESFGTPSHPRTSTASSGANTPATAAQVAGTPVSFSQRRGSAGERSVPAGAGQASAASSPSVGTPSLNQSSIAHDESRHEAVVTSSSSGRNSDPLYSADNLPSHDLPCAQKAQPHRKSSSSSPDVVPPTAESAAQQGGVLRTSSRASSRSTKRMAADSSQEGRQDKKGASSSESQVFQPGSESGGFSVHFEQVPVQGTSKKGDATPVVLRTASELVIGAPLLARWKDGFFYPATFRGLNTAIGNKFKVLFEDGLEKTVRASDLILAQHLPIGQSVLVSGEDDLSDPGMIMNHIVEGDKVLYEIAMDNGSTKRCSRSDLLLTEDQASCLLSEEELRVSFGEKDGAQVNTADVSLDNVILGKRLRTKGSPAVALPSTPCIPSTSTAHSDGEGDNPSPRKGNPGSTPKQTKSAQSESTRQSSKTKSSKVSEKETSAQASSGRKRKGGPVATSTPTPKQKRVTEKQETPTKALSESVSPLGAAISSPAPQKRPARKARAGLFEHKKGPMPQREDLFDGYTFILTYIEKSVEVKSLKNVFILSDTFHRTVKYLQALAANLPTVSHMWIIDSCAKNQRLDYAAYVLPAGISFERHKIMERVNVTCLAGYRILLTSSNSDYLANWRSVLELAQCKVISKLPSNATKNRPGVNVMMTDEDCVPSLLEKARKLEIPIVGSEWVIQCLINNAIMDFDGHPNYSHKSGLYKFSKEGSQ
ncbi:hypothetical protein BaRGS_00016968 [Batillaria attramentaria]|uniref:BRCT domain-containing protein n=1 Tax=Batillaria attramentaria TaxID=370345 RepID=A0ABD0KY51_9CAEN